MRIKPELRILGIDDGSFEKGDRQTLLIGVVFRGGFWLDGIVSTWVEVDGMDATKKIADMITSSKYDDVRVIMLSGITVAGFNTVDLKELNRATGLPVIAVLTRMPDFDAIYAALENVSNPSERRRSMMQAGEIYEGDNVFFQVCGMEPELAKALIRKTSTHSLIPEPLRVSHMIASGITRGEAARR
jgi:endonuclease V-like protein UPF0215 family